MSKKLNSDQDTICAPATKPGVAAISVIRVSGKNALKVTRKLAPFLPQKIETHKVYFGTISDPVSGEKIDQVLVSYFLKSFTGEEATEISCHGNELIVDNILETITSTGLARISAPGEFTYRAFLNSKIDLTQAESVLSLVQASSKAAKNQALYQLRGGLSEELKKIKKLVVELLADLEASIDFNHEDIEIISANEIEAKVQKILTPLEKMHKSYKASRMLTKGIKVAIIGRVNVGKSSILNKLVSDERAIVSSVEGTTRDLVEVQIYSNNHLVTFTDTAGLRDTTNKIEKLGIEKTIEAMDRADMIIFVTDQPEKTKEDLEIINNIKHKTIFVHNKADIWNFAKTKGLRVSAIEDKGIEKIKKAIEIEIKKIEAQSTLVITKQRQVEILKKTIESLKKALLEKEHEFVALEIRHVLESISELLGEEISDDVLDQVFSKFCIGK